MKPPIKWSGGKTQLLPLLQPLLDERRSYSGTHFEPFLGGGSVALAQGEGVLVAATDACDELVEMWQVVRQTPGQVANELERFGARHSERQYYEVRAAQYESAVMRAARFIYLNKTCFNGLWRKNRSGQFNVPIGRGKPRQLPTRGDLIALSSRMRETWLDVQAIDFEPMVDAAREGDVVFADPPYDGTHDYSSDFGDAHRARLAAALRRAARRGVGVVACDADTPLVRRLYAWADVREVSERRNLAQRNRKRAACLVMVRP